MDKIYFRSLNGLKICGIWHIPDKKTDKAIVLAHGLTVDKDENGVFIKLANTLCDSGFAVFRFDFSGHGESDGKSVDMTVARWAKDLESTIDEARKQYPSIGLLGASFGGGTATVYAEKNQRKIKCLCLWNPVLNYDHTFLNPTLPWIVKRKAHILKQIQEKGWTTIGSNNFIIGKGLFDEMARLKPYESLKDITLPTLIIHGDMDDKVPYEDSKKYSKYLINGQFVTIHGAYHGFHEPRETPQAINETVKFFKDYL